MKYVTYECSNETSLITLNNPSRLNAIGTQLLKDFEYALEKATNDPASSVVIINGAGRAFCAGDDLKEFDWDDVKEENVRTHIRDIQRISRSMVGCSKPIIGAVHGYAVGGGFEWLLNCDLVVAADNLVAFFPEMDWGFFVTGGVTHRLPHAVGHQKAMELLLLGERQSAEQLKTLGLVNWVVPTDECLNKAKDIASKLASKSKKSIAQMKKTLTLDLGQEFWQALQLEEQATIEAFLRPDTRERAMRFGSK